MPDLSMISGDIKSHFFRAVDTAGAAIDISGYTPIVISVFAMAAGVPTGAALFSDNLAGDVDFTDDGTDGEFDVPWAAADTASLSGEYYVEVKMTTGSSQIRTSSCIIEIVADKITA